MYCSNCGEKNNNNKFCTNCGINLKPIKTKEDSGLKIASIILGGLGIFANLTIIFSFFGFVVSLIGLILGIITIKKEKNIIGIVLNSVSLFLSIIMISIFIIIFRSIFRTPEEFVEEFQHYEKFDNVLDTY
ncbi:MAG: zinc ribbon domain-containing protein [Bacilli bacterium]|nr:zinc ribbon domain-containing protein [Bacilli bacterium]